MGDRKDDGLGRKRASAATEDEEFDYGDTFETGRPAGRSNNNARGNATVGANDEKSTMYTNRPYDEAVELSDGEFDESVDTHALSSSNINSPAGRHPHHAPPPSAAAPAARQQPTIHDSPPAANDGMDGGGEYPSDTEIPEYQGQGGRQQGTGIVEGSGAPAPESTGIVNPGILGIPPKKIAYHPSEFDGLKVGDDIRTLFEHIVAYKPRNIELDTRIKCFIPEYIPAVGELDAFLKPARPDGLEERLGITTLDEPAATQSDATILELQLRAMSKKSGVEPMMVRSIENADKNPKEIMKWIQSVSDVHKSKPPPAVHYSKPMPDIERLMQEWPPSFEELLKEARLPGADLDMSVEEYARTICAMLDIPVYGSLVQSLHVFFTLYDEFKSNQHFANLGATAGGAAADASRAVDALLGESDGKDGR